MAIFDLPVYLLQVSKKYDEKRCLLKQFALLRHETRKNHNTKIQFIMLQVGEHDENMYIVDSGSINVFSTTRDPRTNEVQTHVLKKVRQGEAIFSLLSFVEYLGGRRKLYKTVSAKATEETRVIKISFKSFKKSFDNYPETLAKVVQVVMVRLQRVTLLALHQVSS